MGSSIAPSIGGLLSKPSILYPSIFNEHNHSMFIYYPYLLPCLFCIGWSCLTLMWCLLFMTESLPTVTSNHREYKVISSIDNDNSSHGFISNDDVDNDTTSDNNDLDDKILTMIRNHRYKCSSSSSSYSTVDETVDMEINDENYENDVDYVDYENNKKNYKNKNIKNESTYDDNDDDDSMDYGMIEMRIINNKIEYVKVDDHNHKDGNISSKSSSTSNSAAGAVINNKMVLRDPKVLLATANYGKYQSLLCLFNIIIIIIFNILLYYHYIIIIIINNAIIKIIIVIIIIIDNIITIVVIIIITNKIIFIIIIIIIITTIIIIINGNSIIIIIIIISI